HTRFSRDWSSDVCSSDLFAFRLGNGILCEELLLVKLGNPTKSAVEHACNFNSCTIPWSSCRRLATKQTSNLILYLTWNTLVSCCSEERRVGTAGSGPGPA